MKAVYLTAAAMLALLLAGCEGRGGGGNVVDNEAAAVGVEANAMIANLSDTADLNDPARLQAMVEKAMPGAIPDAKDAQYRNLRAGVGGAVCGDVASKPAGRAAPVFRPFVINPDGIAVVAATPKLAFGDPNDFTADAWVRWCASPEELQRLAPQIRTAAGALPDATFNGVDAGADSADVAPPPPPPPPAKAAPAAKPPPASVESFFNSVQHNQH